MPAPSSTVRSGLTPARKALLALLLLACVAVTLAGVVVGTEPLSLARAWQEWRAGLPPHEAPTLSILVNQRLPRTLAALLAGSGLALVGCAFQALLRNPLATPYTLGIASAGSLGAYAAYVLNLGAAASWFGFSSVQLMAFFFAGADILLIYTMAARRTRLAPSVLLLAGVTLGMLANAGIMLMRYFASADRLVRMERWVMGGVDIVGFEHVLVLAVGVIPCAAVLLAQANKFDQIGFGAELAAGRGVNVKRLQVSTFFLGSLMTALIVSKVGPIGFVGLIVPHAVRALTGSRHPVLMPVTLAAGGAFLCFCDIIARLLLPGETPIGIITALLGGPFFLYILLRRRFTEWEV